MRPIAKAAMEVGTCQAVQLANRQAQDSQGYRMRTSQGCGGRPVMKVFSPHPANISL